MSNLKQTTLLVSGMTCPSCTRHVEGALRELDGVEKVQVDRSAGKVTIEHPSEGPLVEAMIAALDDAGYPARAT